jgi:hypothetical protein
MQSKEYLDFCLRSQISGKNKLSAELRDLLIKYFPERDSVTLEQPLDNQNDLKNLSSHNLQELNSEFQKNFAEMKQKIFKESNCKKIKGKKLNGFSLCNLIEEFVFSFNQSSILNINTAWDNLIQKDLKFYFDQAVDNYTKSVENLPQVIEQEDLVKRLYEYKLETITKFNQIFTFNQDILNNSEYLSKYNEARRNLDSEIIKHESKLVDRNLNRSSEYCQELLKKHFQIIEEKTSKNYYGSKTSEEYVKDYERYFLKYLFCKIKFSS